MAAAAAIGLTASVSSLTHLVMKAERLLLEEREAIGTRLPSLLDHVKVIHAILHQFSEMPKPLLDRVFSQLKVVIDDLLSIQTQAKNNPLGFGYSGKLDDVENKLEKLRSEHILGALADITHRFPIIANENPHLPSCTIGLDRVHVSLDFLQRNREGLRIVGIHGQGGLGKTTLLNKLWAEVSMKPPFTARAYVALGDEPNPESLCALQSYIMQQLFGAAPKKFPSPHFGKEELEKELKFHFRKEEPEKELKLRTNGAIFLALDNVWDPTHLEDLLPDALASLLPPSSCIVLTSRQFSVIEKLVQLCSFQIANHSHVLTYSPKCLSPLDSTQLFVQNAGLNIDEHPKLLKAIVPLCGGLPLALQVLGSIFKSEAKREESAWEEVSEKMQLQEASFPKDCEKVFKVLQVSYGRLKPRYQEAFVDIAGFFYGWEWRTVERIVGKEEMSALKDYSLLSEAEDVFQCTHSEIEKFGHPEKFMSWASLNGQYPWSSKVVTMHDLILKFGKCLLEKMDHRPKIAQDHSGLVNVRRFPHGNRFLWKRSRERETIQLNDLQEMKNIRFLYLNSLPNQETSERLILSVETGGGEQSSSSFQEGCTMLRFASLEGTASEELLKQILMSTQLRELHLTSCPNIKELYSSSTIHLKKLECLHVHDCCSLQRLPESCGTWKALQELFVSNCKALTQLPEALGTLPNLQALVIQDCSGLTSLPPLSNLKRLSFLAVDECYSLTSLPTLPKPHKILFIKNCPLEELPSLQEGLQNINLISCSKLQNLASICLASTLQMLHVEGTEVSELVFPEDTGNLKSLRNLGITSCPNLKWLPNSICNITSLKKLFLLSCSMLLDLPEEIGKLTALEELKMSSCISLQQIPKSISELQALKVLDISWCDKLSALPEEIGKLISLEELIMRFCENLQQIPKSISELHALKVLDISWCDKLSALPEEIGKLTALEELKMSDCSNLQQIPKSISELQALKVLDISWCDKLSALPEEIGKLISLEELIMRFCENLQQIPKSISELHALKVLDISWCDKLSALPEEIGKLTALEELKMSDCSSLQRIPKSISELQALKALDISWCDKLSALPEEIGKLPALKELKMSDCSNLQQIPKSISELQALKVLDISGCSELSALPEEIGKLTTLEELKMSNCISLQQIPKSIYELQAFEVLGSKKVF